jgi:uncharacterized membrane protein (GlpM family)
MVAFLRSQATVEFVLRALISGLLVATVPVIARRADGSQLAGLAMLFPAVTLASLFVLARGGRSGVEIAQTALSGAVAVVTVVAFLVTVAVLLRTGHTLLVSSAMGIVGWLAVAAVLLRSGILEKVSQL